MIVNCAGRTRSIIGTQSLVNAGIRNPVFALRNGTIGWTLAGHALEHGQSRRYGNASETAQRQAASQARAIADRAGVTRIPLATLTRWQQEARTTYLFDVRDAEEYAAGHLPGSRHVAGGQLVQETDHYASVRGARIVLVDDDGVRANMTGSWLAQLGWQVAVLDALQASDFSAVGSWQPQVAPVAAPESISPRSWPSGWRLATRRCWISPRSPITATAIFPVRPGCCVPPCSSRARHYCPMQAAMC